MTKSREGARCTSAVHALFAAGIALLLIACSPARAPARPAADRTSGPIPVVRAFALHRAGETAEFEVELPDSREQGRLREVFIGVRAVHDPRDPARRDDATRVLRHLEAADIPVHLEVHRWMGGTWMPVTMVTLVELPSDGAARHGYRPHPSPVFRRHRAAHWDGGELQRAGLWNPDLAYFEHEIAGFRTATPGRYRISLRTLEAQPALEGLPYELVVAHSRRY